MTFFAWIIFALIAAAVLIALFAWFYERATNETSLVRTGIGGRHVVMAGGTLSLPYFHEVSKVSMQTLRLDVACKNDGSLITKDRMRVDVGAEFYVSVIATEGGIARASQTLGKRTFQADQLGTLLDGMLVDALRSVAAKMTMDELHENRADFVSDVRTGLDDVLSRYGLQLDTVSLTAMDQTAFSALDENNAFNAVGMRKLAEVIAESKKQRAEIDADSAVSVRRASMEAARRTMEIDLDERRAQIAQQQEIETLSAAQIAEVAKQKAASELAASTARIDMEQRIQAAEIERERAIEIAEQERQISVAAKSQEESRAEAEADVARAEAVKASEAVQTARDVADAERRKSIDLIKAASASEAAAIRAVADQHTADALKITRLAEAEANKALIEAENTRSDAMVTMELERARLAAMPKIVAELVKPVEKIKGISINHISGGKGSSDGSPVDQAIGSIFDMAVQLPALKKIGKNIGVNLEDALSGITDDAEPDKKES